MKTEAVPMFCENGCCEIMPSDETPYAVCADCGNDEGHEHGKACSFCGSTGLEPARMAAREEAAAEEMRQFALNSIREDVDPTKQRYFVRMDFNRVIRSEEELERCKGKVPIRIVSYKMAEMYLKHEDGVKRRQKARVAAKKAAKAARKKNRR